MSAQRRSDVPLASAERLASSGLTDADLAQRVKTIGKRLIPNGLVLINLNDSGLTASQYDRAVRLMREIYPNTTGERT